MNKVVFFKNMHIIRTYVCTYIYVGNYIHKWPCIQNLFAPEMYISITLHNFINKLFLANFFTKSIIVELIS